MSGILRGVPVTPSTYQTTQQYQAAPTLGQQLLTAGSVAGGISAGLGKNFFGGKKEGGIIGFKNGGTPTYEERVEEKITGPMTEANKQDRIKERMRRIARTREAIQNNPDLTREQLREKVARDEEQIVADKIAQQITKDKEEDVVSEVDTFKESEGKVSIDPSTSVDIGQVFPEVMKETEVTETDSSGGGFGFDFEAALPYFVMAAKAQEGGGPKGTTDALIAFGKMKGDQESAKYKKSMAEYQKALAEYTKEKATIDYAKLSAKQLNEEFNREAEIAKILTDQLNDPLSAAGKSREILKAELIRSKQRMRKIQSAITGQPQSKATVKRDTK
jgi:hypothetical protein